MAKLQENIETRRSLAERLQQNKTAGSFFFNEVRDESQVQHADVGMQLGCYIAFFLLLWCVCVCRWFHFPTLIRTFIL